MRDLLDNLNDRQKQAVTAPTGPVLVLAGAGSGKTRVLTYRIVYLLQQKLFEVQNILALTFTNKAAGEMRERIVKSTEKLKNERVQDRKGHKFLSSSVHPLPELTMGTFHAVCSRILRSEIEKLGQGYTANFVIYDADDSSRLIKQILLELNLAERFRPQQIGYYLGLAKNRLLKPKELALGNSFLEETLQLVYEIYQKRLWEQNALDFDDLLQLTCQLFAKHPAILRKYQNRFRYVLVDEYQDTNHAQYVFLNLLVEKHQNLFVVGDDAQSIYGFRGANLQNILDFKKDYPKAKVIMLEENYRSTQNILDAAARVIKLNASQYEKKLWTKNEPGRKLSLYEAWDEMDESEFVVKSILGEKQAGAEVSYVAEGASTATPLLDRLMKQNIKRRFRSRIFVSAIPDNLQDYVVLYRTHAQSRPLEEVLLGSGIPYQIVGGIKFYERKEIKDVVSYLRLVINPRDLVSLSRVINLPARGIGNATFKNLGQALPKYNFQYRRVLSNLEKTISQPKALAGAREFFGLMERAVKFPKDRTLPDLMNFLLVRSGYKDSLLDGSKEGESRWENIEELFNVAAKYKRLPWAEGVRGFLEEVALMTDLDSMEEEGNHLTLMTLHSAKGLEFENVFLVGLEEGLLPHSRSLLSREETAEEIRLAYVGMTRARRNLYLSYARQRQTFGELKQAIPSRILKAIPKKLVQKISNF